MQESESTKSDIRTEYENLRPYYEGLVEEVSSVLNEGLNSKGKNIASISGRIKAIDSLMSKIQRKAYINPLQDITDFAGVRAVCHYESEVSQIANFIRSNFDVHKSVDKSHDLGVSKMGYNGLHFIVSLGDKYSGAQYEQITKLKCEIQVRTVLQDAWALISHHLIYKAEATVPQRLRRDLNNVASLLEIAQGVFDSVKEKREAYRQEIVSYKTNLSAFLSQRVDFETILAYTKWKFPKLPVSEQINLLLLNDLDIGAYPTLAQVDAAVEVAKPAVEAYRAENPDWFTNGTDFITKSLGFVDQGFRTKHPFSYRTQEAFKRYEHLLPLH